MATMTNQSKTSLAKCKWCDKEFKSDRTLAAHMCVKKRRWGDKDMTHIRLAHRVFQMFYDMNTASSKPKSMEDFIRSSYYEGFTKFGRSCLVNEYLKPESFAEWLIKNGKKLTDWSKDSTYDAFLLEYVRKEPGMRALERTIIYLNEWAQESGKEWNQYFMEVSTGRAVHDIRACKISPWVLYLSETGDQLLTRFNSEQIGLIEHIIDATFWMSVFKTNDTEVDQIQETCSVAKL